jgi:hypothetical protein
VRVSLLTIVSSMSFLLMAIGMPQQSSAAGKFDGEWKGEMSCNAESFEGSRELTLGISNGRVTKFMWNGGEAKKIRFDGIFENVGTFKSTVKFNYDGEAEEFTAFGKYRNKLLKLDWLFAISGTFNGFSEIQCGANLTRKNNAKLIQAWEASTKNSPQQTASKATSKPTVVAASASAAGKFDGEWKGKLSCGDEWSFTGDLKNPLRGPVEWTAPASIEINGVRIQVTHWEGSHQVFDVPDVRGTVSKSGLIRIHGIALNMNGTEKELEFVGRVDSEKIHLTGVGSKGGPDFGCKVELARDVSQPKQIASTSKPTPVSPSPQQASNESRKAAAAERQRLAKLKHKQEETRRLAELKRKQEEYQRIAEAERKRQAEAQRLAERKRQAEAQRLAERKRQAEAQRLAELDRKRKQEEARQLAAAEVKRKAEAKRVAEIERKRKVDAKKIADAVQKHKAEAKRLAAAERKRKAEAKRLAEAERKRKENEARRLAEVKRKAKAKRVAALERKRKDEAKRFAEVERKRKEKAKRLDAAERKQKAEAKRVASLEKKRKAEEVKRRRAAQQAASTAGGGGKLEQQLSVLKRLRANGLIDEQEFKSQKKALLVRFLGLNSVPSTKVARTVKPKNAELKKNLAKYSDVKFGTYHALVIGSNNYKYLPKLKTAKSDAKAVAKILKSKYGYKVKTLINATRNDILDAFDVYRETLTKTDNLLVYYAGHGYLDEEDNRGYWMPVDARPNRRRAWLSNSDITGTLKALKAKHVMVMADSCYSGTLTRGLSIKKRSSDYVREVAAKKARVVITSGGLEPVADKSGGAHSPFASVFLDVLNSNNGVLDGTKLFNKMRRPVMLKADQTPAYADVRKAGHDGGDFLFVRRR